MAYPLERRQWPALRVINRPLDVSLGMVPAHSRELEAVVIAAMAMDTQCAKLAMAMLKDDDFYVFQEQIPQIRPLAETGRFDEYLLRQIFRQTVRYDQADIWADELFELRPSIYLGMIELYCVALQRESARRRLKDVIISAVDQLDNPEKENRSPYQVADLLRNVADDVSKDAGLQSDVCTVEALGAQVESEISGDRSDFGWPWPIMSGSGSMMPGSCMTLCGPAGAGKSFFEFEMIWRPFFNGIASSSMNMEKHASFHLRRAFAQLAGKNGIMSDKWVRENRDEFRRIYAEYRETLRKLEAARVFQTPALGQSSTLDYLLRWLRGEMDRGVKIMLLDPVSNMTPSAAGRLADEERLVSEVNRMCGEYQSVVIFSTHPKTLRGFAMEPATDNISGSQSFSRFVDSVFWLMPHAERNDIMRGASSLLPSAAVGQAYNRTVFWLKTKLTGDSAGTRRVAMKFNFATLCYEEVGILREENK